MSPSTTQNSTQPQELPGRVTIHIEHSYETQNISSPEEWSHLPPLVAWRQLLGLSVELEFVVVIIISGDLVDG